MNNNAIRSKSKKIWELNWLDRMLTKFGYKCFGWTLADTSSLTEWEKDTLKEGKFIKTVYKRYTFVRPAHFSYNIFFNLFEFSNNLARLIRKLLFYIAVISFISGIGTLSIPAYCFCLFLNISLPILGGLAGGFSASRKRVNIQQQAAARNYSQSVNTSAQASSNKAYAKSAALHNQNVNEENTARQELMNRYNKILNEFANGEVFEAQHIFKLQELRDLARALGDKQKEIQHQKEIDDYVRAQNEYYKSKS